MSYLKYNAVASANDAAPPAGAPAGTLPSAVEPIFRDMMAEMRLLGNSGSFFPEAYGAVGNGVADDTTALQAAVTAASTAGGGTVWLQSGSTYAVSATINVPANVKIIGASKTGTGIVPLAQNLTLVSLAGIGSGIENCYINAGAAGANSSGAAITTSSSEDVCIARVRIYQPFTGILVGSGATSTSITEVFIDAPTATTGIGVSITGGDNIYLTNVFTRGVEMAQCAAAVSITGGGGHVLFNVQGLFSGDGLVVLAGSGVDITWLFCFGVVMDTGTGDGFLIQAENGGTIQGVYSYGGWSCSMSLNGVVVTQDNTSTVDDVHLIDHRSMGNGQNGVGFLAGSRLYLTGGTICQNSTSASNTYYGVTIGEYVVDPHVQNCVIGIAAGFTTPVQAAGITCSAARPCITGNTLIGNISAPLAFSIFPTEGVICNNVGVDDVLPTLASASTLTLPVFPTMAISGSATVTTMNGGWAVRVITVIPTGPVSFATGGNIANAFTATAGQPFLMVWTGSQWYVG